MKRRKTRVQKTEGELRQAKKTISDLEKSIAALSERIEDVHKQSEKQAVSLHKYLISAKVDTQDLREETVFDLNSLKHNLDTFKDVTRVYGRKINCLYKTAEKLENQSDELRALRAQVYCMASSSLWKRLTRWMIKKAGCR